MSNELVQVQDKDIVVIEDIKQLPYLYIPYPSIAHARAKHPYGEIYHYVSPKKIGWQIIAWPILMTKKEEVTDDETSAEA